jgi:replicative DNA helicase Mcm
MKDLSIEKLIGFVPSFDHSNNLFLSDITDTYDIQNILSVAECLRLHTGDVKVQGTITSISRLYKMIKSVAIICVRCGLSEQISYPIPTDDVQHMPTGKCNCGSKDKEVANIEYVNAVKIEIQDSDKFSEIERLICILFDENTKDIQIGSKIMVTGCIQIIKQKNRKRIPTLYSNSIKYENKDDFKLTNSDIDAVYRFTKLNNGLIIDSLRQMIAPSVIGLDIVKEGLLLSAVSTSEEINIDGNRERIHLLVISNPGGGKSTLIKQCIELVPNSRYESSQHASGKSLTAIVSREDEDYCLRTGPVPLAQGAICVLNEMGKTNPEDQAFLLDVMEEGEFTINKYGINSKIKSPTVIVASANPISTKDSLDDKIDLNQIPIIKPIIDRFDLIFVLKDSEDEETIRRYAEQKLDKLSKKIPNYNQYLKKHIAFSKKFKPVLTEESNKLIIEYYINLTKSASSIKFKSKRILETIARITKSICKLKLKNIVEIEDVKEALEFFNAVIYQYTESIILIPEDPKNITISVFKDILKESPFALSLEELVKITCEKNPYVKSYLLGNNNKTNNLNRFLKVENNRKLRGIYELLIENSNIKRINEKPIALQWINFNSLSDITKNKTNSDRNDYDDSNGPPDMSYMSDNNERCKNKDNKVKPRIQLQHSSTAEIETNEDFEEELE